MNAQQEKIFDEVLETITRSIIFTTRAIIMENIDDYVKKGIELILAASDSGWRTDEPTLSDTYFVEYEDNSYGAENYSSFKKQWTGSQKIKRWFPIPEQKNQSELPPQYSQVNPNELGLPDVTE
jgi:hypothetical protein